MLSRPFNDPLRGILIGRPTLSGYKAVGEPFVPITPAERGQLLQRLAQDEQNMVCTGCGSTKPMSYYKAIGAICCCPERKMVPTGDILAELDHLRLIAPQEPCSQALGVTFGAKVPAYARGVSGEAMSARVSMNSSNTGTRMFLNLTKRLAANITLPRVDARYGTGTDADKLLLTFGDQGAFQFCRDHKSKKFYVILPPPAQLDANQKAPTRPCDYGWREIGRELVVTLPIDKWLSKPRVAA